MEELLFLVHRIPYPPNKGDKIRSFNILRYMAANYQIHLGCFIDDTRDWQHTKALTQYSGNTFFAKLVPWWAKIKSLLGIMRGEALSLSYYKNAQLQAWVDHTIAHYKITKIFVFSSTMAQFVEKHAGQHQIVIDFVDVDSDKWLQYSGTHHGIMRWVYRRESQYLLAYEQHIARCFDRCMFVSEQECQLFAKLTKNVSEKLVPLTNGVDLLYFNPTLNFATPYPPAEKPLVFTGAMDYWANIDAVIWFSHAIFPYLRTMDRSIKFYIVGSNPAQEVLKLAKLDGIVVTGWVDDIRPFLAYAKVCVAPLRIARGIQNKVLETMAMAKPLVATTNAMEGIMVSNAFANFVNDDAKEFARLVHKYLDNNEAKQQGILFRHWVEENYNWDVTLKTMTRLFN